MSIGTFSLIRSAKDDFLASAKLVTSQSYDLRDSLSEWYFYSENLEKQYELLRVAPAKLSDYENTLSAAPVLRCSGAPYNERRFFDEETPEVEVPV